MAYHSRGNSQDLQYEDGRVVVYADGSCLNNGQQGAQAGIGVYFGPNSRYNVSEPLRGSSRPTNINAEVQAVTRALQVCKNIGIQNVKICTDSMFFLDYMTNYRDSWTNNGWIKADGKPVENRAEFQKFERAYQGMGDVKFQYVPAHSKNPGNDAADALAKSGAARY